MMAYMSEFRSTFAGNGRRNPGGCSMQEFGEAMLRISGRGVRFRDLGLSDEAIKFLRTGTISLGELLKGGDVGR